MTEKEIKALKYDTNITSEMTASKVHLYTNNLQAIIYGDKSVKLIINEKIKSPYGYTKTQLLCSHFAVKANEFTFDYVKDKVDEVYSTFPNEEIHELFNKIKKYNNG